MSNNVSLFRYLRILLSDFCIMATTDGLVSSRISTSNEPLDWSISSPKEAYLDLHICLLSCGLHPSSCWKKTHHYPKKSRTQEDLLQGTLSPLPSLVYRFLL